MAKPRHKGKSKQKKPKPKVVIEATATPVEDENLKNETNAQTDEVVSENGVAEKTETVNSGAETGANEGTGKSAKELKKEAKAQAKKDKEIAKEKAKKKKEEQRERAGKIGIKQRIKETGSELKKVSWPSFKEVMKKTGVVIAVVLFFAVILFAFDYLLSVLYNLMT